MDVEVTVIGSAKTGWWSSDWPYWNRLIVADLLDWDRQEVADDIHRIMWGDPRATPPVGILNARGSA